MANVLVIGGTRGIGLEVVKAALKAGHRIRALARDVEAPPLSDEGLEWRSGDATEEAALTEALDGIDVVVMALGVKLRPATLFKRVTLFSDATEALIPAMRTAGLRRLIAVTGFGAGESRAKVSALESVPFRVVLGRAYDDKTRQEAMIESSGLEWTIVRPGILTNGRGRGRYRVLTEPEGWRNGIIARADVAHFIVAEIDSAAHAGKAPVIVY